ncbi:MAG: DNA mismatch endonuclease Vsr [Chromatiales bacterium]|nr:DNA mismatch endonuclease Vsr [Chromatiales bacterium]
MADIVDRATRSRMMSGIRGRDTKPELQIRRALHRQGFRYRLHAKDLPGRPDIVLPKYNAVVFVHGCFWHGHDCEFFKLPSTHRTFWRQKIVSNRTRDSRHLESLQREGWRVMIVWECAVRGATPVEKQRATKRIGTWIKGRRRYGEVRSELRPGR